MVASGNPQSFKTKKSEKVLLDTAQKQVSFKSLTFLESLVEIAASLHASGTPINFKTKEFERPRQIVDI